MVFIKMNTMETEEKIEKMLEWIFESGYAKSILTEDGRILNYAYENDVVEEPAMLLIRAEDEWHYFWKYMDGEMNEKHLKAFIHVRASGITDDLKPYKMTSEDFRMQWHNIKSKIKTVHFIIYDEKMEIRCDGYSFDHDRVSLDMCDERITEFNVGFVEFLSGE